MYNKFQPYHNIGQYGCTVWVSTTLYWYEIIFFDSKRRPITWSPFPHTLMYCYYRYLLTPTLIIHGIILGDNLTINAVRNQPSLVPLLRLYVTTLSIVFTPFKKKIIRLKILNYDFTSDGITNVFLIRQFLKVFGGWIWRSNDFVSKCF